MIAIEFGQLTPNSSSNIAFNACILGPVGIYRFKLLQSEAARRLIVRSNLVDDLDGFRVSPLPHEIFRTFVKVEHEEPDDPEDEHERTHGEKEVAPPHV